MKMDLAHENLSIFPTAIYSSDPPPAFENIKVKTKKAAALTLRYSIGNETTVRLVGSKRQEKY